MNIEINKISNNVYIQDCENCSIFGGNEKLIIGFGVKDLVVVDAGDVILVMDKDKDQEIKHLLMILMILLNLEHLFNGKLKVTN